MDAATISAIAEVVDAIPDGPYIVIESPFPALEQIGGGNINLGSTFGDVNLPFGEDFLDVEVEDDNSTHVSDVVDVNAVNGAVIDSGSDSAPDAGSTPTESGETPAEAAPEEPEVILPETPADSDAEQADAPTEPAPEQAETEAPAETDTPAEQAEPEETEQVDAPVESAPEQPAFDPVGFLFGAQK
ncbi:hypothetical protein [Corynebacterium sp. HMSC11E11]|uniref:hypothetical protein n=1 Tax=Corynebacterium sp. HMSC11E11 TaxID=1581089 RepID=UPI0008A3A8CE|nr:hypothetical protein [Corynebacterium sp. HMSC11E11]OFU56871.1 hypothetical protein HMPREF3121_04075 [Corynebacterium sp. HMSC11E11]